MKAFSSWLDIPADSDFSIYNLPFGIFSKDGKSKRAGIAIGSHIVDLAVLAELEFLEVSPIFFRQATLNDFIALGKKVTRKVRLDVQLLLTDSDSPIRENSDVLVPQSQVQMHLPVRIGDYTDFYSSIEHATNIGKMFRDPDNALLPNWKHIPVGYHGRASSVVVSGTDIKRPKGQMMPKDAFAPIFKPTERLDFELEMAFIIGKPTELGKTIATADAENHIFGMVLFNDWSARDIQKWEYVPLGPFLGKSFASSMSPWIVTQEALEPFRVAGPKQDPEVLPYLKYKGLQNYDIRLEVQLTSENGDDSTVSISNFKYMYWNMLQQLAHHTINGCNVNVGDVMASGTISGKNESSYGSMLEIAQGGKKPIAISDGSTRSFIADGDSITLRGFAEKNGIKVGFGEVVGKVIPSDQ